MGSRIALVSREFPPRSGGGIGAYAASIAPALARAGSTVHVITRSLASGETEPQHPAGVRVHRLNMGDRSGESCLRSSLVVARKLLDIARADGLDAIEFAEYEAMASAWLALRSLDEQAARIAVAVHLHSPTELNAELNGHDPAHLDPAMRTLIEAERRCIALADGVCAPGSFMADWATRCFAMPARPVVIPYAAAPGTLAEPTESSRVLLYVGRLERRKGVDTLIQAWNRIAPEHPGWALRLVGDDTNTAPGGGSCRAWLDTLLAAELTGRTEFAGPMDSDQLQTARRASAIAVIPSRWENFPNTCIEAMAAGLPVVASDHGGMAEMLGLPAMNGSADGESGSVFPAGDDALLAQSLGRWMSMGSEARIAAGTAARDRMNTLCDPRTVAQRRIQWLGSLAATPGAIDPTLADLLQVGAVHPGGSLDTVLARTLDRYDRTTGAAARAGDPAQWIERVRAALADLGARGLSPVALYGAGHFARSIGPALENPPADVVCIIDDNPQSHGHTLHALPIVSQTEAMRRGVRAVVLCANQWEDKLWAASEPVRSAGIEVVRLFSRRPVRVMVVESGSDTRHFAGVARELERRGIEVVGDSPHAVYPVPDDDLDLVCVADVLAPRNIAIARSARAKGIRTLLMMDGIVEWRNTFINPLAGPDFLRPAPVDFICCATTDDERHLVELGNTACATGLPRLDGLAQATLDPCGPVLVATANTPSFNDDERARLLEALARLKQHASSAGIDVRWRLTGGLERAIGVHNHPGLLVEAMSGCRGLISTPSTLLLEGELAGLPIAVLDPFGQSAFDGMAGVVRGDDPVGLLGSLPQPGGWVQRVYPPAQSGEAAASRVADRIAEIARSPGRTQARAPFLNTVRLPAEIPRTDRPRAVSVIVCDGSPTSGVTTFSLRMSEQSAARDSGWEWHTLLVQTQPRNAANDGLRELRPERLEHVHVCVLDPTADHHETLRACRDAIELLHPDVLAPNFSDMTWAVAAQLRYRGIRTLGIMHSDDDAYRALLADRPVWDAGVAVSAECTDQMRSIASERFDEPPPVEQITYGVPVAETLPRRSCTGPIRLLYVGRLIEHQKRVSRLIELAMHLRELGCAFTLDLIGDGPSESGLRSAIEAEGLGDFVHLRGRLTPEEVQAELNTADGLVLVSDFEGTSIAMLEAMGRGVIPCVSRVASGVDEWVEDGSTGLTAPVGDTLQLAQKIAAVASDPKKRERLQAAAWHRARDRASASGMFERYTRVLKTCRSRPLHPSPSDLVLHLSEGGRWLKTWCEDYRSAEVYALGILRDAGFRNIARDRPEPGCDAVLVNTANGSEAACHAERWRMSGLGVACFPLIIRPGWLRLGAVIRSAMEDGARRIALYGAGLHTRRALPMLLPHLPIIAVIDDHAAVPTIEGIPVVTPAQSLESVRPDAVILSSDHLESVLWHASLPLREAGIPVFPVYTRYEAESPPSVAATV